MVVDVVRAAAGLEGLLEERGAPVPRPEIERGRGGRRGRRSGLVIAEGPPGWVRRWSAMGFYCLSRSIRRTRRLAGAGRAPGVASGACRGAPGPCVAHPAVALAGPRRAVPSSDDHEPGVPAMPDAIAVADRYHLSGRSATTGAAIVPAGAGRIGLRIRRPRPVAGWTAGSPAEDRRDGAGSRPRPPRSRTDRQRPRRQAQLDLRAPVAQRRRPRARSSSRGPRPGARARRAATGSATRRRPGPRTGTTRPRRPPGSSAPAAPATRG